MPESDNEKRLEDAVLEALQEAKKPLGPAEIAEITGSTPNSISQLLRTMLAQKKITKKGRGEYVLPDRNNGVATTDDAESPDELFARLVTAEGIEQVLRLSDDHLGKMGLQRIHAVEVGAGAGREVVLDEVNGEEILPAWYIRTEFGVPPTRLKRVIVKGDSMNPTLLEGQRLYVALWEGEPLQDGVIYVLYGPEGLMIKRLVFDREDGEPRIWIWSDNEERPRFRLSLEVFERDYRVLAWALEKTSKL